MRNIDMHCHSTRSDGKNSPEELLREAQRMKLDFLALTDHDVISPRIFQSELRDAWIKTCDSVEISARNYELWKSLHLVSYARIFHDSLQDILTHTDTAKKRLRKLQFQKITETLWLEWDESDFSLYMTQRHQRNISTSNKYDMARYFWSIGSNRPKIVDVLQWLIDSDDIVTHFFEACFKRWGSLYEMHGVEIEEYEPSVEMTVQEVVNEAWWVVSLAHPNVTFSKNKWWIPEFQRTIWDYIDVWVNAIEINVHASPEWIWVILEARQKFWDLLITQGTDCHMIWYDGRDGKHASLWISNPYIIPEQREYFFSEFQERVV